jgi:hypothetical protein
MMTQRRAAFLVMTEERSNIFLLSSNQGWETVDGNGKGVNRINVGSKVSIMRLSLSSFSSLLFILNISNTSNILRSIQRLFSHHLI